MSDWRKRLVLRIIHENGGRLVRRKRHLVFRFPDGRKFVAPSTPSDLRAWRNSLSVLMRFLGVRQQVWSPQDAMKDKRIKRRKRL